jgi:hypothetical protein
MDPDGVADAMLDCTLPHAEWTHRGHVTAAYALVRRLGAPAALAALREGIPRYNASVGTANTDSSGYHDTITAYYVWAISRLVDDGADLDAVLAHPLAGARAPLAFWTAETLFSVAARRGWVAPDLVPNGTTAAVPHVPEHIHAAASRQE